MKLDQGAIKKLVRLASVPGQYPVVCVVDNSGSTGGQREQAQRKVLIAMRRATIQHPFEIWCSDTEINQKTYLEANEKMPDSFTITMGGGTDFRPVIHEADKLGLKSVIYLTDGDGPVPDESCLTKIVWGIIRDDKTRTDHLEPFGPVINLSKI